MSLKSYIYSSGAYAVLYRSYQSDSLFETSGCIFHLAPKQRQFRHPSKNITYFGEVKHTVKCRFIFTAGDNGQMVLFKPEILRNKRVHCCSSYPCPTAGVLDVPELEKKTTQDNTYTTHSLCQKALIVTRKQQKVY